MRKSIPFVKKIRILLEECHLTDPDEQIIDALIFGSNSKHTLTNLLEKDATLIIDTALHIARTEEVTSKQLKGISVNVSTRVDALKHCQASSKASGIRSKPRGLIIRLFGCRGTEPDISQRSLWPGHGSTCGASGKENHWKKVCRTPKFNKKQQKTSSGRAKHSKAPKGKSNAEKHLHNLEVHDEIADGPEASFPDQLYCHTLSIDQVTKEDTQATDLSPSSTIISAPGGHSVLKEPLKKELDSLVEQGILAKVTEPTLVFVTKSTGALRLCLDLRT